MERGIDCSGSLQAVEGQAPSLGPAEQATQAKAFGEAVPSIGGVQGMPIGVAGGKIGSTSGEIEGKTAIGRTASAETVGEGEGDNLAIFGYSKPQKIETVYPD